MPISKFDLKMQCLGVAKGNIDEAERLYKFLSEDMELPDTTPRKASFMEQTKQFISDGFTAYKENKDDINEVLGFIQGMIRKNPIQQAAPKVDLPPIPEAK